jgi:hypothetical protein
MAANTDRLDPYAEFKSQLDIAQNDAYRIAKPWKLTYVIIRAGIIIFSVLTSAGAIDAIDTLGHPTVKAAFGLIVVLLTAFDSWLKADVKYHIHYQANDTYARLTRKLALVPPPKNPDDPDYLKRLEQISDEFDRANEVYATATV